MDPPSEQSTLDSLSEEFSVGGFFFPFSDGSSTWIDSLSNSGIEELSPRCSLASAEHEGSAINFLFLGGVRFFFLPRGMTNGEHFFVTRFLFRGNFFLPGSSSFEAQRVVEASFSQSLV
jgi:hypothetical protein